MSRPIAVLRPQPGNEKTAAAIERAGRRAIRLPLFAVRPLAWEVPDPAEFDALLLTSANTLRHGGAGLAHLAALPVHAVGNVTAEAARGSGFAVAATGTDGAEALLALAERSGVRRALHLGGEARRIGAGEIVAASIAVYASEPVSVSEVALAALADSVALIQSPRAGDRLAALINCAGVDRASLRLAAISTAAAEACGGGWSEVSVAPTTDPDALLTTAFALAD